MIAVNKIFEWVRSGVERNADAYIDNIIQLGLREHNSCGILDRTRGAELAIASDDVETSQRYVTDLHLKGELDHGYRETVVNIGVGELVGPANNRLCSDPGQSKLRSNFGHGLVPPCFII